jgi:Plant transposon protein
VCIGRFASTFCVTRTPVRLWEASDIKRAIFACVLFQNMIIDKRFENSDSDDLTIYIVNPSLSTDMDLVTLQVQSLENLEIVADAAARKRLKAMFINRISRRY